MNVTCWQWPWTSTRGTVPRGSIHWRPGSRLCCWRQKQVFLPRVVRQEPLLCPDFPQRKWHPLVGSRIGIQVESAMMETFATFFLSNTGTFLWNYTLERINIPNHIWFCWIFFVTVNQIYFYFICLQQPLKPIFTDITETTYTFDNWLVPHYAVGSVNQPWGCQLLRNSERRMIRAGPVSTSSDESEIKQVW